MPIRWHVEAPEDLREAIRFTAQATGFLDRLIEKDYFCSVILEAIAEADTLLVFKGGTCLAKTHSEFFRLSEDLDFAVDIDPAASKAGRSRAIAPIKPIVAELERRVPGITLARPLEGYNESRQYNATLTYRSLVDGQDQTIALEISLRETLLTASEEAQVRTAMLHWMNEQPLIEPFGMRCLSYPELMAEKIRAALTRREPAIRDFFDIDHAVGRAGLAIAEGALLQLLRSKLGVPGTEAVDVSTPRLDALRRQLETDLRPVLRAREFDSFDLDRAFSLVTGVVEGLG